MEENKNNKEAEGKTEANKEKESTGNNTNGINFEELLKNVNIPELLKHLLSGAGAMAGNYFIWIKPLQEKLETLIRQSDKQENRIRELEKEQERLKNELNAAKKREENDRKENEEYFSFNRRGSGQGSNGRYSRVNL
jgi:hypothetical protein